MNNSLIAVRSKYAVIKTVWLSILDSALDSTQYQVSICRMDKRHCVTTDLNFAWLKTEDAIELVRPGYGVTAYVPVKTAYMGQVLRLGQLALALLELLLRPLAILNVDRYSVPLKEISLLVEKRRDANQEPARLPVSPAPAHFIFVRFAG